MRGWNLYFITDSRLTVKTVLDDAEAAVNAGVRAVQYREKSLDSRTMSETAKKLKKICAGRADFIVDDRLDIALASDADGLHAGEDDLSVEDIRRHFSGILGRTVHSVEQARRADDFHVDYLSLGHIFPTSTKHHSTPPLGLEVLRETRAAVSKPLGAIGGIKAENVESVICAGADFACMVSEIACAENVREKAAQIEALIRNAKASVRKGKHLEVQS
ncbi:MAG: thiamine phosphate synthase [Candidatus Diapherotrites archaeon]|nr:thiamine phosphate synthase [Candidatus Diapherotrites archaeon]